MTGRPAAIRWRIIRGTETAVPWSTAVDHGRSIRPHVQGNPPTDANFAAVYAPDTTQNKPNIPGNYHFWVARQFDTDAYPDGNYQFEVEASDVRGNPRVAALDVTIVNAG